MTDWTGRLKDWKPPDGWRQILTIDVHAAGEPVRVIVGGFPELMVRLDYTF
jgi:trans-L-3-hydroxyproline dehydratase